MKMHFLLAEWNNLITANYQVPGKILLPFVPHKTELDLFEGKCYVSLVGFMYLNTRVLGLSIPMHVNFEEVNLRFYIRYNDHGLWKRGVVFVKEIVPKMAISFIANNLFSEKYVTMKMKHFHIDRGENFEVGYEWYYKNKWNRISAVTDKRSRKITPGSSEQFFTDHYWGYTKYSDTKTYEYEVTHPGWETLSVISQEVDCHFGALFGAPFAFLENEKPETVLMTRGSEIRVHHKKSLG